MHSTSDLCTCTSWFVTSSCKLCFSENSLDIVEFLRIHVLMTLSWGKIFYINSHVFIFGRNCRILMHFYYFDRCYGCRYFTRIEHSIASHCDANSVSFSFVRSHSTNCSNVRSCFVMWHTLFWYEEKVMFPLTTPNPYETYLLHYSCLVTIFIYLGLELVYYILVDL